MNILIVIIGLIVILIFALLFIIKGQRTKNKVLHFESEQRKANEDIYALMLKQHAKIEEGRLQERHRISEELHDGILNKLLGSRLGLEYLSLKQEIDKAQNILLISHQKPDGDTLGSNLALLSYLKEQNKNVASFCIHPLPLSFEFLQKSRIYQLSAF